MKTEMRNTAKIKPYEKNPRKNEAAVDAVAKSIREFGFRQPIVIDKSGLIIVGHARWKAAKKLGLAKVPVHVADLILAQAKAYRIADNKTNELADWDMDLLGVELEELRGLDFDMESLGFSESELLNIMGLDEGLTDPDAVPEPPEEPVTKPGDLWILGEHRLLCGDSTKAEDVARLMGEEKAMLCFTSPPYATQRDYTKRIDDWDGLMCGVFANLILADDGQVLVNLGLIHRDYQWVAYWDRWIAWMEIQGWRRFGWYVWDQGFGLPGDWNGRLAPSHEFIFHFNRRSRRPERWVEKKPESITPTGTCGALRTSGGKTRDFASPLSGLNKTKIADSVIRVLRQQGPVGKGIDFPAPFSVGFAISIVKSFTLEGEICFEPFAGSGSQIIACEQLGRKCRAMEIEPRYVDVSVKRWEEFTGKTAERITGGKA